MRHPFSLVLIAGVLLSSGCAVQAEETEPAKPAFTGRYEDEHFGSDTLTITLGKANKDGNLSARFAGIWEGDLIEWVGWLSPVLKEGEVRGYCEEPNGEHQYELSGSWKEGTLELKYETGTMTLNRTKK